MLVNPNFWEDKKVLLTGHTGFKGSWLCLWLRMLNAEIIGLSLSNSSTPSMFDHWNLSQEIDFIEGDIRDENLVRDVVASHQPEIVIHMAAQALVRQSYKQPVQTYATNIMGTVHVLDAIRQSESVKAALIISSDKCYENVNSLWGYRETDPFGGHDPYSSSKGCVELVTNAYRQSFFLDAQNPPFIASARAGNVIGGGDWSDDRLIPDIIRAWNSSQKVQIRYPNAIRPWQHVIDVLNGYLLLVEKLYIEGNNYCGGWNFGPLPHEAKTVEWIVRESSKIWGVESEFYCSSSLEPEEAHSIILDCTKARRQLDWAPHLSLPIALQWTMEWYKDYYANPDENLNFSQNQINQFFKLQSS